MSELTVVIPTHNRVEVLGDCLRAVAAATPDGETIEVVVVDDGSTDQTRQLLAKAYPQVRVLHFEHARGPAAARNAGIAAADGPWCLIINDDTILDSAALGVFLAYRRGLARREVSVIGNIAPWPEQITAFEHWCSHGGSQFTHARIPPERYEDAGEDQFVTSNILVERDLLLAHPFDESFRYARYEDRELGYRLARRSGHRIHYLPAARSYHCHRLGFAEWLGKWKTFGAAAIHFASLYPEDTELRRALSIERAERTESFSFAALLQQVSLLNDNHQRYFAVLEDDDQPIQPKIEQAFRALQEFARLTYLRELLGLSARVDPQSGSTDRQALGRIRAALKPEV